MLISLAEMEVHLGLTESSRFEFRGRNVKFALAAKIFEIASAGG